MPIILLPVTERSTVLNEKDGEQTVLRRATFQRLERTLLFVWYYQQESESFLPLQPKKMVKIGFFESPVMHPHPMSVRKNLRGVKLKEACSKI